MGPIPLPEPALADGVVALRPFLPRDVAFLVGLWADPDVGRWTGVPADPTAALAERWVASRDGRRRAGRGLDLVVTAPGGPTSRPLGTVSLDDVDLGRAAVGYAVAREARCRGVATRAVGLLVAWALAPAGAGGAGLRRVRLRAHVGNLPSARVARTVGFAPVACTADADDGRPVVTWWRWAALASTSVGTPDAVEPPSAAGPGSTERG